MKQIILAIALIAFGAPAFSADTQRVCQEQTDPKTKKAKQVCKEVRVHKKLEVEAAPAPKAK